MTWEIVGLVMQFFKKKTGSVPRWLILVFISAILGSIFISGYKPDQKTVQTSQVSEQAPEITQHTTFIKPDAPRRELPTAVRKEQTMDQTLPSNTPIAHSESDPTENTEAIKNYTAFHNALVDLLKENGYSDLFSRNLAYKIRENLENGRLELDDLFKTIKVELGEHSTDKEAETVKKLVIESVGRVAKPLN